MAARMIQGCQTSIRCILFANYSNPNSNLSAVAALARCYSTSNNERETPTERKIRIKNVLDKDIKKSVFISQSYDVFTNLALEEWLYKNFDFSNHHVLMLWANDPCVVIGKFQNPFAECSVSNLMRKGIPLARRNSGGGTVYHDRGNLNCTFFSPRERCDRKYNLNILTRAFFREWGIKADISPRDDIMLGNKKISGTAARLGQPNAYHHCTVLVDSDKLHLSEALQKDEVDISGKGTPSVRSPIKNLKDANKTVNIPQLLSAIGYEYLRTPATELVDGGRELAMKQRGFQLINPTEKWFPGINEIRENFASWDWRFGKTEFSVQKELYLKAEGEELKVRLQLSIDKGLITEISLSMPTGEKFPVISNLRNQPYTEDSLHGIIDALKGVSTANVKQAMSGL